MKRLAIAAISLLATCGAASSESTPQGCAAIDDSLQRLTCFDRLFPKSEVISEAGPKGDVATSLGPWDVTEERSPIDDSPRISAFLLPKGTQKTLAAVQGPSLILRCRDNVTTAIYFHGKFGVDDRIKTTYRIAGESPKTEYWTQSDSREAVGLWDGAKAIPFMKKLKNNTSLAIKTEYPISETVFDLGNVEEIVSKISTACNWN